jgi:hypothetical protein
VEGKAVDAAADRLPTVAPHALERVVVADELERRRLEDLG